MLRNFALPTALAGVALLLGSASVGEVRAGDGESVEPRAEATLVAATTAAVRGGVTTVGVRFTLGPGTHLYWRNPGDAGMAPSLKWTLPEGVTAGEPGWPAPRRFESGGIVAYGYGEEFLLPVEIRVAAECTAKSLPLKVDVSWLACTDICIAGEATLSLDLLIMDGPAAIDGTRTEVFERSRAAIPVAPPKDALSARVDGEHLVLTMQRLPADAKAPWFFPEDERTILMDGAQVVSETASTPRTVTLRIPLYERHDGPPKRLLGVLAWDAKGGARRGWIVDVELVVPAAPAGDVPPPTK
jgi:thiol:disulfide interchange protein DsbD